MGRVAAFYISMAPFNNHPKKGTLVWSYPFLKKKKRDTGMENRGNEFSVSSAYKELNSSSYREENCPWKMIWEAKIPYELLHLVTGKGSSVDT